MDVLNRKSECLKMIRLNEMKLENWLSFYTQFKLIKRNCGISANRIAPIAFRFILFFARLCDSMLRSSLIFASLSHILFTSLYEGSSSCIDSLKIFVHACVCECVERKCIWGLLTSFLLFIFSMIRMHAQ
jgi:hypothetical protein